MADVFLQPPQLTLEQLLLLQGVGPEELNPKPEPFLPGDPEGEEFTEEEKEKARVAGVHKEGYRIADWEEARAFAQEVKRERSGAANSWAPVDLDELFDAEQEMPTVGAFIDDDNSNGGAIFYAGKVNEIHGPSESGKTMVLLAVAAQEIRAGNHVVMVDFEDSGKAIVGRLRWVFGLEREEIVKQFHYFNPETHFGEKARATIEALHGVTFCIIDAVTESMAIAGLNGRDEGEVAAWYNDFPKKLSRAGMCVALVDHTGLADQARQIGSQHKKSAVDGVSYTAEPIAPFVKGGRGVLYLKVAKDKPGGVRPSALPQGDGKQFWRGSFVIDGKGDPNRPRVLVRGVDPNAFNIPNRDSSGDGKARDLKTVVVPPPSLCIVLEILAQSGEPMTAQKIMEWHNDGMDPKDPGRLNRTAPRKRAVQLVERGLVERVEGGGSIQYRITPDGLHAANGWANRASGSGQISLESEGSDEGSEP